MTGFCSRCGAELPRLSRFCGNCGARLRGDAEQPVLSASELNDITQEVPPVRAPDAEAGSDAPTLGATPDRPLADRVGSPPTIGTIATAAAQRLRHGFDDARARLRPPVERWWTQQRGHSARNSMVACAVLLLIAIGFAWTAGGGGGGPVTTAPRARSTHRSPARRLHRVPPTTTAAPAVPDNRVSTYVAQIEGILQQSAAGHAQLAAAVRSPGSACGAASPQADQQLTSVVDNRNGLVHQLDVIGPGPNAGTQVLFSLLHQALEASTQADVQYRNWNAALGGSSSGDCSTDPSAAAALAAAHSYDSTASTYKAQFVAGFNPLAAQLGLPTWSATAF